MIEYDQYGEPEGCTHNLGPHDMDSSEAWEARRTIHQATDSVVNWALHLEESAKADATRVKELEADLSLARQHLRIAHGFINWVVRISEDGPRVELDYLKRRAERALMGEDRHESHPPRPPLDT